MPRNHWPQTLLEESYHSTTIFLSNFYIRQLKIKEQIILSIIRWRRKLFWSTNSHWLSLPLKSMVSHQCKGNRESKKKKKEKKRISSLIIIRARCEGTERHIIIIFAYVKHTEEVSEEQHQLYSFIILGTRTGHSHTSGLKQHLWYYSTEHQRMFTK